MDANRAKELLSQVREQVEKQLSVLKGEGPEEGDGRIEPGDEGSEGLYQDQFDAARVGELERQLEAVERAEERLAAGTYGLSVRSGEPIPDERSWRPLQPPS